MEDKDKDGADSGKKLVVYKLLKPLGEMAEGELIKLDEEAGEALCDAGIAAYATEGDLDENEAGEGDGEGEESLEHEPMVANSVKKLTKRVEKTMAEVGAKVMATAQRPAERAASVPASVKEPVFKSVGHYVKAIIKNVMGADTSTENVNRITAYQQEAARAWGKLGVHVKSPLGINEGTNSQGGYLVNPQFSPDVYVIPHNQVDLAAMCDPIEASSNLFNQRFINESSLVNGSIFGGLNMVATSEGASFTSSLPAWSNVTLQLQKLAIFAYYTVEVLQDASYPLEADLNEYTNKAFLYGINTQIIQGSTLEGALNAPSLVTVTKSSNDTSYSSNPATCLTYADVANMWAQVYPDSQVSPRGVWLFHPSLTASLTQMTYTFSGSTPAWGLQYDAQSGLLGKGPETPYRLFGKAAYPSFACSAPGAAGDILYVDFGTFRHYRKPFRVEVSREFQFGTDQIAVRWVARLDCKTIFRNKVTGVSGTQQFSPIVTRSAAGT